MSFKNSAAALAPQPQQASARPRGRRKSSGGSLTAHGEPLVWLTGGALFVAIVMIVGLLSFIFIQGTATFWPARVTQLETLDGKNYLGEVTDSNWYAPEQTKLDALPDELRKQAEADLAENDKQLLRRSLLTGNKDLTGSSSVWIDEFTVKNETNPEWVVVLERLENGRFYGLPKAFLLDGKEVAADPAEVWAKFNEYHAAVCARWHERYAKQKYELGTLSRQQKDAELNAKDAELAHGKQSPEYLTATKKQAEVDHDCKLEEQKVLAEIQKLDAENDRYQMRLVTAQGKEITVPLAGIVRAYPANQLGFWGRAGVYLSRWNEFLFDEPRNANQEGGVFPAIWGTVAMTLIMSVLVVPFGVLAALYLREYAKAGPIITALRIAINNLAGVPSIVFGVFGLGFFCYTLGGFVDKGPSLPQTREGWFPWFFVWLGMLVPTIYLSYRSFADQRQKKEARSRWLGKATFACWLAFILLGLWLLFTTPFFHGFYRTQATQYGTPTFGTGGLMWASLTLALLTLPVVIVATEESLSSVPNSMREGSYACGASKWQTIRRIVLPRALPGIMTGMILAMARGAGEVAPLMLVGVRKMVPDLPVDGVFPYVHLDRSFMHLAYHIKDVGMQSVDAEASKSMVFTTTLLLILIIFLLNASAIWLRAAAAAVRFRQFLI